MAPFAKTQSGLRPLRVPPVVPGKAYTLESLCGEVLHLPFSKTVWRLQVTGKVSEDAIAVVTCGGSGGDPIGFHYHNEAHDTFLCLKGSVNVWAGDQARTMYPGDFANVPPRVVHSYQMLGDHSEFIGLLVPGGWDEFFRFMGEPYEGAMWPFVEEGNPAEVLPLMEKRAAEQFDMVPQRHIKAFPPQSWVDGADNILPGDISPYFLRGGTGPAYLIGGSVVRPLATTKETGGKFSIGSIEGSSWHGNEFLMAGVRFDSVHHAFYVVDGQFQFHVDGASVRLNQWETFYVPKGTEFGLQYCSRYAKAYIFASGNSLVELFRDAGETYAFSVVPEQGISVDIGNLQAVGQKIGCTFALQ